MATTPQALVADNESDPLENAATCILREWLSELQREYTIADSAGRKRMAQELAVLAVPKIG